MRQVVDCVGGYICLVQIVFGEMSVNFVIILIVSCYVFIKVVNVYQFIMLNIEEVVYMFLVIVSLVLVVSDEFIWMQYVVVEEGWIKDNIGIGFQDFVEGGVLEVYIKCVGEDLVWFFFDVQNVDLWIRNFGCGECFCYWGI